MLSMGCVGGRGWGLGGEGTTPTRAPTAAMSMESISSHQQQRGEFPFRWATWAGSPARAASEISSQNRDRGRLSNLVSKTENRNKVDKSNEVKSQFFEKMLKKANL